MPAIYATNTNAWHNCAIRTNKGAKIMTMDLNEKPMQKMLKDSGIDLQGSGINIGSGINGYGCGSCEKGKGINIAGKGALVPKCETMNPAMNGILIRRTTGGGLGSFLKQGASKLFSYGKKNLMPQLLSAGKDLGKQLLESGKRVALDAAADVAGDLTNAAVGAIGDKVGNKTVASLLQTGAQTLGKQAQSSLNSAVAKQEQQRQYSANENKLSSDIANRSRSLLQNIMSKNKANEAAGTGARSGTGPFVNDYFST
jgi:hypothetical protein